MRGALVALDLETTGLDIENDSIIEVGAVRLQGGKILEEFTTLVNPGFEIPPDIVHLTGIYPEDVVNAPTIDAVLPQISDFVGDAPLIAHNVGFDLNFLRRFGILKNNKGIDTYDIAAVLLPQTARYTLSNLTKQVGIELENAHRALDDARATALLYWHLWEKALQLPNDVLNEIGRAASALSYWDTHMFFKAAVAAQQENPQPSAGRPAAFDPLTEDLPVFKAADALQDIDETHIQSIMDTGGQIAQHISNYEKRPQQIDMARAITRAFNQGQHMLIEAGTGTGKSLAYLVPAIEWAITNNQRVTIATNTINLQDQLMNKDIPLLQEILDTPFRAAVMKGRANYICPRRLDMMRRRTPSNIDEFRALSKILVWLQETETGDRGEITLRGLGENMYWRRLSAEDEGCTIQHCQTMMRGTCPFFKARKQAEAAQILVVNHALLISDAVTENRVLPDYQYLVIDEAHQFEDAITNGLSKRVEKNSLLRRVEDVGGPAKGLLGDLLATAHKNLSQKKSAQLENYIQQIGDTTDAMRAYIIRLYEALHNFLIDIGSVPQSGYWQIRIQDEHRRRAAFAQIETTWKQLAPYFEVVSEAMYHLTEALQRMENDDDKHGLSEYTHSTEATAHYLQTVQQDLHGFVSEPDANTIYWLDIGRSETEPVIHTAPLHIGPMMDQYIWQSKRAAILTSATLQTEENFKYIQGRLYADSIEPLNMGSPFDYEASTLVYIPQDIPAPNTHKSYQRAVERGIIELATALDGRVMVLFTSYSQLRETAQNISSRLALGNIIVYDQSAGSSRETLLEEFKSTQKAVLLGTKSFWQGIDIPGDDLSALVIARLPFSVPNDPIFASRSESYNNAFKEFAVPDAILRFRQGFGRLIRTQADRGIVAIFDSRILTKNYGHRFLESLPNCTIQRGTLEMLPQAAVNWLDNTPSPLNK